MQLFTGKCTVHGTPVDKTVAAILGQQSLVQVTEGLASGMG